MNDFYMDRLDMVRLEYDRHVGISVKEMEKKKTNRMKMCVKKRATAANRIHTTCANISSPSAEVTETESASSSQKTMVAPARQTLSIKRALAVENGTLIVDKKQKKKK